MSFGFGHQGFTILSGLELLRSQEWPWTPGPRLHLQLLGLLVCPTTPGWRWTFAAVFKRYGASESADGRPHSYRFWVYKSGSRPNSWPFQQAPKWCTVRSQARNYISWARLGAVLLVSELCNRVSACHHLSHWTRSQASARWVSHTVPAEACDRFRTQDGLTQLLLPTPLCLPCQSLKLLGMSSFPLQLFLIEVKGVGIGIQVTLWGAFPLRVPGGVGLKPFWKSQVGSVCEWGQTGVGRPGWASSSPQCRCTTLTTTRTVFLVLDSGVLCNRNCRSKVEN